MSPRSAAHLRAVHVDEDTGEVIKPAWELSHAAAIDEILDLQGKYKAMCDVAAERERIIQKMERDREAEAEAAPERALIEFLHAFWQKETGHHQAPLGLKRHELIAKLLREYSKASAMPPRQKQAKRLTKEERQEVAARRIMCAVVCVGRLPYSDFGERVAQPRQGADRAARMRRDSWEFIAELPTRFEGLAARGYHLLRESGEKLPDLPARPDLVLVKDGA